MPEYIGGKEEIVNEGDIININAPKSPVNIGVAIMFKKDGDYNVTVNKGRYIVGLAREERKNGKWERIPYSFTEGYKCSCCGCKSIEKHWNFCPNCGADMGGER